MELLHVFHCLPSMVACCLSFFFRSHGVASCLFFSLIIYRCLFAVFPSALELLLHVSLHLPGLLAIFHCLSGTMVMLHVSHSVLLLLPVYHCPSQCNRVSACHSLSPMVACCLLLSLWSHWVATCLSLFLIVASFLLLSPWSFSMFLTVFHGFWLSPLSFIVACCLLLSLRSHGFAACLTLSCVVAGCLSLSLPLPWNCWLSLTLSLLLWSCYMSLTISYCCWLSFLVFLFHVVSVCLSLSTMVSGFLSLSLGSHRVAACLSLSRSVAGCISPSSQFHGFAACLSLSHMIAGCFSLSLMIAGCLSLSLRCQGAATCFSLSLIIADSLSQTLPVPWSCCMSLTVFYCC